MNHRFTVYNASAGSGKTFNIAKHYLNKIMQSQDYTYLYTLLGVTFTNKAASEMKTRVLQNLIQTAKGEINDVMSAVMIASKDVIQKQTGITDAKKYKAEFINRSKKRLDEALHRYDDFQLTTIDKMMYKIIHTFARDMDLPADVEVVLDYKEIISNLIDKLIAKSKKGDELSEFLIEMSKNKVDDQKSWDIKNDLFNIKDIIFDDNYFTEIKTLQDKKLSDFKALKKILLKKYRGLEKKIHEVGKQGFELTKSHPEVFNVSVFFRRFIKSNEFDKIAIGTNLIKELNKDKPIFYVGTKHKALQKTDPVLAQEIAENINTQLLEPVKKAVSFIENEFEDIYATYNLTKAILREVNGLSIQKALLEEIETYKAENHSIFINDFNKLILEQILKNLESDTPYIYMRLGEKYRHYFVDEFQDTSDLQWHNLIPLIKEALSKEFDNQTLGDAMLVGDAKQSIYRFRGGKPEQFIALSNPKKINEEGNPFYPLSDKNVENLQYNWRSQAEIVGFNNRFFSTFTQELLLPEYQQVYENVIQKLPAHKAENEGYVQIQFLDKENKDHAAAVLEAIQKAAENGFTKDEICILINRKKEGYPISDTLISHGIDIISSETLLVANSKKVQFLMGWINFLENGATDLWYPSIQYLAENDGLDKNILYTKILKGKQKLSKKERIAKLEEFGYYIDYKLLTKMNLYDVSIYLIQIFGLHKDKTEQAYLQAFVEEIHQFYTKTTSGIRDFINHWNRIQESFSIHISEQKNAVNMMTVHKAKGLEFPVVIYYANADVFSSKDKENKVWVETNPNDFAGFSMLPVAMKSIENSKNPDYQTRFLQASEERKFDNLNRLYVALTRASEQLYIILNPLASKTKNRNFNQVFKDFLDTEKQTSDNEDGNIYIYGNSIRKNKPKKTQKEHYQLAKTYFNNWAHATTSLLKINTKGFERWQADKKSAIAYGTMIHDILSQIETYTQWQTHKQKYLSKIKKEDKIDIEKSIEKLLTHPDIVNYFTNSYDVLNERDILIPTKNHKFSLRRPDRILIKDNKLTIIDYKTGVYHKHHEKQVDEYAHLLTEIGYVVDEKILVYLGTEIRVKRITNP